MHKNMQTDLLVFTTLSGGSQTALRVYLICSLGVGQLSKGIQLQK